MIAVCRQHFVERVGGGEDDFGNQAGMFFYEFGCEDVFQIVREFAEFAVAAGGGIAFQGVNGAADAAKSFFIVRAVFERKASFIHGLENFFRTLEEEFAEFGSALVVKERHLFPSIRWYTVALF